MALRLLGPMCYRERVGRCVARAERSSKGPVTLLSLSSGLPCPAQLSHLLTWALVSFLLIPIKHPASPPSIPRLSCEVPKIHTQTRAVPPGETFEGRPRGCYEQTLPPSCANSSHAHARSMSLPASSLTYILTSLNLFSYFLFTTR